MLTEMDLLYRFSLTVVPTLYVGLSRLWFGTCRLTVREAQYIDQAREQGAVIVPFWHYSIFYMLHHLRRYPGVALVSASRDGEFIARIAQRLDLAPVDPELPRAVGMVVNRPEGLTVLLTERSHDLPDHPGQISFPGGRIDPGDADAAAAALREAREEVGLPAEIVTLLGELSGYETVTGYSVRPIVGWVEPPFDLVPDPIEVADVFEVPLAFLLEPANQQRHYRMLGTMRRDFFAIPYRERYIWGATAAMLMILDRTLRTEP